jgi:hypothetical protein
MTSPLNSPSTVNPSNVLVWSWERGGTATVVRVDGLHVEVHSSTPYPPGAPLIAANEQGTRFEIKVRGCRKLPSGQFAITGSLVNLTRDLRVQLLAALQPSEPAP